MASRPLGVKLAASFLYERYIRGVHGLWGATESLTGHEHPYLQNLFIGGQLCVSYWEVLGKYEHITDATGQQLLHSGLCKVVCHWRELMDT
jgi:hypothetical protein